MNKELVQNKEWLYKQYIIENKTANEIAKLCDTNQENIYSYLHKYGIKRNGRRIFDKPYDSYDYLYEEYINKKRSMTDIGNDWGVSSEVIKGSLIYNNIDIRSTNKKITKYEDIQEIIRLYTIEHKSSIEIAKIFDYNHTGINDILRENKIPIRKAWESRLLNSMDKIPDEYNDKEYLYNKYWVDNMSSTEIGEELGISAMNIRRKIKQFNIPIKTISQALINKMSGEKHPNWQGGITPLYDKLRRFFHEKLAPIIWKRDNYQCQLCNSTHVALHAHHIKKFSDIVKEICNEHTELKFNNDKDELQLFNIIINDQRFLDLKNNISLCRDCHIKLHKYEKINYDEYKKMTQILTDKIKQIYKNGERSLI